MIQELSRHALRSGEPLISLPGSAARRCDAATQIFWHHWLLQNTLSFVCPDQRRGYQLTTTNGIWLEGARCFCRLRDSPQAPYRPMLHPSTGALGLPCCRCQRSLLQRKTTRLGWSNAIRGSSSAIRMRLPARRPHWSAVEHTLLRSLTEAAEEDHHVTCIVGEAFSHEPHPLPPQLKR
jgi:hypothetical protein